MGSATGGRGEGEGKVRGKERRCQEELQVWAVFLRQDVSVAKKSELDSRAFRPPRPLPISRTQRDGRGDVAPS